MSLRVRMGLAAGVAVAIAVIAVAVTAFAGTRSQLRGQVDSSLQSLTASLLSRAGIPANGHPGPRATQVPAPVAEGASDEVLRQGLPFTDSKKGPDLDDRDEGLGLDDRNGPAFGGAAGTLTLVRRNGTIYVPRGQKQSIPPDARIRAVAARGLGRYFADREVRGTEIRELVTGIGWRGALVVALPLRDVNRALASQALLLVLVAAGGVLLAGLLGLLVARTALAPIARFTGQAEQIAANPERLEHQRLVVHGQDEIARLGQTFNRTLDALESSIAAQRNLVADASHELRTPVATIRANLQLMRDEELLSAEDREALRTDVIEELDELTALVGDVVELARGAKPSGEHGDVRLDEITAAAIERTRRRAPQLTIASSLEPTLVRGEGDRIARAVANLLDNAAKWSPPQGTVEVELRDGLLTVRDHGPGFHEEDLPFLFDRFHRARDARSKPGSGLGLAIVRQAADAHGGFVEALNAPDGGALMRISFGPRLALAEAPPSDALSPS
ncbi:MAG TPA: HAMP domain-containing sensor histidine kinase [Solirubrobacteraceae bacterium]